MALVTSDEFLIVFSNVNPLYISYIMTLRWFSASDKAKLFTATFSKNSNLEDSGISFPAFPSVINQKLHNNPAIPDLVKKIINNLDSSKEPGPVYIPVVVPKSC